ncbi:MAG: helix-turn-helix domain-containing protein [Deltaproteobacteria bacterium]|nr:helix-turn-helix domain-containing protein [Deltaproteobacteria bacterium]
MTLLTVRELSALIKASPSTLYEWASTGKVPGVVRFNGSLRFNAEVIERWLEDAEKSSCILPARKAISNCAGRGRKGG